MLRGMTIPLGFSWSKPSTCAHPGLLGFGNPCKSATKSQNPMVSSADGPYVAGKGLSFSRK
jgi:hypothetical protein